MQTRNYFFALVAVAALAFAFYGLVSFSGQPGNIAGNYQPENIAGNFALSLQEKTYYFAGSGKPVFGVLHSIHTTFGGAAMTQAQRVAALKSTYDWAATVDHDYSLSQSEWDSTRNEANSNNSDNSFTYFPGYEWKGEKGAEVLVFFKDNGPLSFAAGSSSSYNSISELSSWLAANNGMGQANHPARTGSYNFNDPAYVNETQIPLISMINKGYWHWNYSWDCAAGSGCTTYTNPKMSGMQGASGTGWVKFALDKGYHYGFTGETDEHEYPLTADAFIGLVDPPSWTRDGIFETLRKRHTWAAEDKIMMSVKANNGTADYVMGDIFSYRSSSPNMAINYDINAVSGKTITDVSLFYKGVIVKAVKFTGRQTVSGAFSQSLANGKEDYLFIEAIQSDGKRAWSSPMWITFTLTGGCTTDSDCSGGNICCGSVCRAPSCSGAGGCGDGNSCTVDVCNAAGTCSASCSHAAVIGCVNGDGCCPSACNSGNDSDCAARCGNGFCDVGETCSGCSGDCACGSGNICCGSSCIAPICTSLSGCSTGRQCISPSTCSAVCRDVNCGQGAITSACFCQGAARASGYCCSNLYQTTPCAALCGGITCTAVQLCCNNSCTTPFCTADANCQIGQQCANPGQCSAVCQNVACGQGAITSACYCQGAARETGYCCDGAYQATVCPCVLDSECASGKICCAGSCSDAVCSGNGQCDDHNAATVDVCNNAGACDANCAHTLITVCGNDDGYCPAGCNRAVDSDCSEACGNGLVEVDENCSSCPADVHCASGKICCTGFCIAPICSSSAGCSSGQQCIDSGSCVASCQGEQCGGAECVGTPALMNYISQWKTGAIGIRALMLKIALWKAGTAA